MKKTILIICLLFCLMGCGEVTRWETEYAKQTRHEYDIWAAAEKEKTRKRRQEYVDEYFPSGNIRNAILKGDILLGMVRYEVKASIGQPKRGSVYTSVYGTIITWDYTIYGGVSGLYPMITFNDNIVTSIFYP